MAVQYVKQGTWTAGTGALSVPPPAGVTAGNLLLLLVSTANDAVATPTTSTGTWIEAPSSPSSTGTINTALGIRMTVFYKFAETSEANASLSDTGFNYRAAMIYEFSGVDSSSPFNAHAPSVDATSTSGITLPSLTTTLANTMFVGCIGLDNDAYSTTTIITGTWANSGNNVTNIALRFQRVINTGVGGGLALVTGNIASAGATGTVTNSTATAAARAYISYALNEAPVNITITEGTVNASASASLESPSLDISKIVTSMPTGLSGATALTPLVRLGKDILQTTGNSSASLNNPAIIVSKIVTSMPTAQSSANMVPPGMSVRINATVTQPASMTSSASLVIPLFRRNESSTMSNSTLASASMMAPSIGIGKTIVEPTILSSASMVPATQIRAFIGLVKEAPFAQSSASGVIPSILATKSKSIPITSIAQAIGSTLIPTMRIDKSRILTGLPSALASAGTIKPKVYNGEAEADPYTMENQVDKYELSIWNHSDDFIGLLRGKTEFDGQAYDVKFSPNINGSKNLNFSIPLYLYDNDAGSFVPNPLWTYILNEQKIRLIRNKKQTNEEIYDFVIKNFVESRDGEQKFASVECRDFALYELGKVGFTAVFNEDTLENNDLTVAAATINFWTKQVLRYTNNFSYTIIDNWSSSALYMRGDLVKNSTTGFVYKSLKNDNTNQVLPTEPTTSNTYWTKVQEQNTIGWKFNTATFNEASNITGWVYNTVPEYAAGTTYNVGAYVRTIAGTNVYKSLKYNNIGHALTDTTYWEFVQTLASVSTKIWQPVAGTAIEKERIIKIEKSNVYNMLQELAEKFQVWVELIYTYNDVYKVIGRTVNFKEEVLVDSELSFRYGVNINSISRVVNSDDIVTKMYVAPVDSEFDSTDGYMSIDDAPQNQMMENFLYNFDYYYRAGLMSAVQYADSIILAGDLRTENIKLRKEQANWFNKDKYIQDLYIKQDFIRAKRDGALETAISLENQMETIDQALKEVRNRSFVVIPVTGETYPFKVNLSSYKGVVGTSFANFKKSNNSTAFTTPPSTDFLYDTMDPTRIIGIKFASNPDIIATTTVATNGTTTATVGSKTGLFVGLTILGHSQLPEKTTITAISPTTNEITLSNSATGTATISCTFTRYQIWFDFDYNPSAYQQKLIDEYTALYNSYFESYEEYDTLIASEEANLLAIEEAINTIIAAKDLLITTFERSVYSILKEGNWQDDKYILKKETLIKTGSAANITLGNYTREEYYSPNQPGNSAITFSAYHYATDLNDIDFNSIQLWSKSGSDYVHCYSRYVDYNIEYGSYSGGQRLLLVPTFSGALYGVGGLTLFLKYKKISDSAYFESAQLPYQTCNIYKRTYAFTDENIIQNSIKIYSRYDAGFLEDESKTTLLLEGTDYLLSTSYDPVTFVLTTTATLKATQNAILLTQYPRITVDNNNSVKFFFNDARDVLTRSSYPKVSYEMSVVDLSILIGYKNFTPYVGQKVHIVDTELFPNSLVPYGIYGFISQIDYDLDNPENTQITITNYKTKFEDIFQRIVATTEATQAREGLFETVNAMVTPQRVLNVDVLQNTLYQNYIELNTSGDNSVIINERGIVLTDLNGDNPVPGQIKIIGNGIFLSRTLSGGQREWTTAVTANGINAAAITTGLLNTKNIIIWNEDQKRFIWNAEGLFAYREDVTGSTDFNTFVRLNQDGLLFQRVIDAGTPEAFTETPIALTWDGLVISSQRGAVTLTSDYGLRVFDDQTPTPIERIQIGRLYDGLAPTGTYGMRLSNSAGQTVLITTTDGDLSLIRNLFVGLDNNAAGMSGDFIDLTTFTSLYPDDVTDYETLKGPRSVRIWSGNTDRYNASFKVLQDGSFYASQAYITGNITATSGSFTGDIFADGGYFSGELRGASGSFSGSVTASSGIFTGNVLVGLYGGSGISGIDSYLASAKAIITSRDINTDTFTTTIAHGLTNGMNIIPEIDDGYTPIILTGGISTRIYYVINATTYTFKVALIAGGNAVDLTTNVNEDLTHWRFKLVNKDDLRFWAGQSYEARGDAPFRVYQNGNLVANNATLTGTMNITSGNILGSLLINAGISGIDGTAAAVPFWINAPNTIVGDRDLSAFYIDNIGTVYSKAIHLSENAYIDGNTYFGYVSPGVYKAGIFGGATANEATEVRFWINPNTGKTDAAFRITGDGSVTANDLSVTHLTASNGAYMSGTLTLDDMILNGYDSEGRAFIGSSSFGSGSLGWGWIIRNDGSAVFNDVNVRGSLESVVFQYNKISAVGGDLYISPGLTTISNVALGVSGVSGAFRCNFTFSVEQTDAEYALWVNGIAIELQASIKNTISGAIINISGVTGTSFSRGTSVGTTRTFTVYFDTTSTDLDTTANKFLLLSGSSIISLGSSTNKHAIHLYAQHANGPYIDIFSESGTVTRLGNLTGVNDSYFGALSGDGLYSQNVFLTGKLYLPNAGITNEATRKMVAGAYVMPDGHYSDEVRMWAGNDPAEKANAPFVVTHDGSLYATQGIFSGVVQATNSTFSGYLITTAIVIDKAPLSDSVPNQFYVAYDTYDGEGNLITTNDNLVLKINASGISMYDGVVSTYSDNPINTRYGTAEGLFPYVSSIDNGMRLSVYNAHIWEIDASNNFTTTVIENTIMRFTSGTTSNADYTTTELALYNTISRGQVGLIDISGNKSMLLASENTDSRILLNTYSGNTYGTLTNLVKVGINTITPENALDVIGIISTSEELDIDAVKFVKVGTYGAIDYGIDLMI